MRLIDADAIPFRDELKRLSVLDHDKYITAETLEYMLEHAPTVDAVPVIRCKDCKFSKAYYHGSESNLGMFTYLCTQGLYGMNADDYCSRAERRGEE